MSPHLIWWGNPQDALTISEAESTPSISIHLVWGAMTVFYWYARLHPFLDDAVRHQAWWGCVDSICLDSLRWFYQFLSLTLRLLKINSILASCRQRQRHPSRSRVAAKSWGSSVSLRRWLLVDPHLPKEDNRSSSRVVDNPLSQNPDSSWRSFFRWAELEKIVDQDLSWLYPEDGSYFRTPRVWISEDDSYLPQLYPEDLPSHA
jgi:hypothetical protein